MTTIAFRDGILAADSMISCGSNSVSTGAQKITQGRNSLIGACGNLDVCARFLRWASQQDWTKKIPDYDMGEDSSGIVILRGKDTPYNIVNYTGVSWFSDPEAPFYAWGSGIEVALGALHHGASAVEAVEIASRVSYGTGGKVRSTEFPDIGTVRKKK